LVYRYFNACVTSVKNRKIHITLPANTPNEEVEVIIKPLRKSNASQDWKHDWEKISKWDIEEKDIRVKSWQMNSF
jgi:hypothetical protein